MSDQNLENLVKLKRDFILIDWMDRQLKGLERRKDLINEKELKAEAAEFLNHFIKAISTGNYEDITTKDYKPILYKVGKISKNWAKLGFNPSETATFIFNLKNSLIEIIQVEFRGNEELLRDSLVKINKLLDKIGLISFEEYVRGREEVINTQDISLQLTEERTKELKNSEENWKSITKYTPDHILMMDTDAKVLFINYTVPDLTVDEVIGKSYYDFVQEEYKEIHKKNLNKVIETGKPYRWETGYVDKVGNQFYFEIHSGPVWKEDKVIGIINRSTDITERKRSEEKLKESEEKWKALSENSPAQIWVLDLEQNILFINRTASDLSQEEVIGKSVYNFIPKKYSQKAKESYKFVIETSKPTTYSTEYVFKDGSIRFYDVWVGPVFDSGKIIATISHSLDVTERKRMEQKLRLSEKKYREAYNLVNFYKDLFAHDMNNILQSIVSNADYYSTFRDNPEKLKELGDFLEIVKNQVGRGSSLILKVKKLSDLEESEINLIPIVIFDVLNKSVGNAKNSFPEKDVNIKIEGLSKDLTILGNDLLIEIFDNILNNSVKFGKDNQEININLIISKIKVDDINYIRFEFKDHGIGIPENRKETLFRQEYSKKIDKRGMGIGLSLVKKIVDRYEGKIWVEDRIKGNYEEGSNFVVLLKEAP